MRHAVAVIAPLALAAALPAACGGAASAPTGPCLAQATAIYDSTPVARLTDGSVWASLDHVTFTEVRGPRGPLGASDVVAAGSTAYGTGIVCALVDGGVWCVPLPGPLLDSTNLGAGSDFTVVTEGAVRVVVAAPAAAAPRPPLEGARQLAASMNGNAATFCAVTTSGAVLCWGSGDNGLLGRGASDRAPFARPVLADAQTPFAEAVEVRLGFDSACARARDGSVWCWGDNSVAQAGFAFAESTNVPFPVRVPLPAPATRLAASPGRTHCAILEDDRVACWGWNADAQAGAEASTTGALPTIVLASAGGPPLTGVTDLAPDRGMQAMCANTKDRGLVCWGHPFPRTGAPDATSPYPVDADATTSRPLSAFGERDGTLVYVDAAGRLTLGAGRGPLTAQPACR